MVIGVITVSDRSFKGIREDMTGPTLIEYLKSKDNEVIYKLVPDDIGKIKSALNKFIKKNIPLIITNGGTGFAKRDVTPEATKKIIEKEASGIMEYIRIENSKNSINSYLSRGVCGIKNNSIIINLPGSPDGALQCYKIVENLLEHGIKLLNGEIKDCNKKQ